MSSTKRTDSYTRQIPSLKRKKWVYLADKEAIRRKIMWFNLPVPASSITAGRPIHWYKVIRMSRQIREESVCFKVSVAAKNNTARDK